MSYCTRCGAQIPTDGFCPNCGLPSSAKVSIQRSFIEVRRAVEQDFSIDDAWAEEQRMTFQVRALNFKSSFSRLERRLAQMGYMPFLRAKEGRLMLSVLPRPPPSPSHWIWNLILLLATIGTTIFVGYRMSLPLVNRGFMASPWDGALTFSAAIIGVLGCHELGHKFMADRKRIAATLPYFIPVPFFIGTLGALIKTKAPAHNRDALFDLGAAGPIAGFIAIIPVTILGLFWSYPTPIEAVPEGTIGLSTPILFNLLQLLAGLYTPRGFVLLFHPVAFAAWVGMVITMLNLMPSGMLDGGHIARAVFSDREHRIASFGAAIVTIMLGWWYMAILMLFFSFTRHLGPLDDASSLTTSRKALAIVVFALLVLCAAPGRMIPL